MTLPCLVLAVSTSACFTAIAKYYATLRPFSPVSPGSRHLAFPHLTALYNPSSLRSFIPIVPEYQFLLPPPASDSDLLTWIGLPNMGKIIGVQYVQKKKKLFSYIWTVGLFRSNILYIFTWFCQCCQCKDSFAYPHFPYRDSDMVFHILCLLSHFVWRCSIGRHLNLSPSGSSSPRAQSFIDNSRSFWLVVICVAYTLLTRPSQVETAVQSLQLLAFSSDSIMSLSR